MFKRMPGVCALQAQQLLNAQDWPEGLGERKENRTFSKSSAQSHSKLHYLAKGLSGKLQVGGEGAPDGLKVICWARSAQL